MEWIRGEEIGHGSFATISKAKPNKQSPIAIAIKSSQSITSSSLKNEKSVLERIGACPQIIQCFGDQITFENNASFYNLLLEYASNGSLADRVKLSGGKLPENEIRRHTKSILKGLSFVHAKGFVHCDIKLQNILVFGDGASKIADFGLAKEENEKNEFELRGTPLYMSPESVSENLYQSPSDIWALGCAVAEMSTGRPIWSGISSVWSLLMRITGSEEPEIAGDISEDGKDFLRKCLVKDPKKRWTAEMLLNHPFVVAEMDGRDLCSESESSPRCPFEFDTWVSGSDSDSDSDLELSTGLGFGLSGLERIRKLVTGGLEEEQYWSFSESWVTIRG